MSQRVRVGPVNGFTGHSHGYAAWGTLNLHHRQLGDSVVWNQRVFDHVGWVSVSGLEYYVLAAKSVAVLAAMVPMANLIRGTSSVNKCLFLYLGTND